MALSRCKPSLQIQLRLYYDASTCLRASRRRLPDSGAVAVCSEMLYVSAVAVYSRSCPSDPHSKQAVFRGSELIAVSCRSVQASAGDRHTTLTNGKCGT